MKYLIILVVLAVGGIAGFFVGSLSGSNAKEALRTELQRSEAARKDSEAAQKSLQDKIATLVSEHTGRVDALNREKADALAQFEEERKGRSKAIQDASAAKASLDKRLDELDKLRRAADPGSANKKNIEAEMGRLASENAALTKRVAGLECGRVPLPKETLEKFSAKVSS